MSNLEKRKCSGQRSCETLPNISDKQRNAKKNQSNETLEGS